MRGTRLILLAAIAGMLAAAADRDLTGRVVDANTGEPIARAHVTLRFFQGSQPSPELVVLSDSDGSFKVTGLPAGGYSVMCEKAGYLPSNQSGGLPSGNAADAKATMVLKLTAQAAVDGTVVDERNLPAPDTFIQLVRQQVINGRRQWQTMGGGATDETGSFRVFGLAAGRYYISIGARLSNSRRARPVAYPPLYYPNATDIAAAQPLDLQAGDEADIKIRLPEPVPAYTVSGVVVSPASNASIALVRQQSSSMFQQTSGDLNWDARNKSFKISHVPPGVYTLTASAQQDGRGSAFASMTVTVGGADVGGIRLEPADASLDGVVRVDESTTQQKLSGFISLQSERAGQGGQLDADGKFHIPSIQPGTYRVVPQINSQQVCIRSVLSGGRDVRDGLTIAAGVAVDPIEISMSAHCGSIDVSLAPADSPLPPNLTAYLLRRVGDEYTLEKQGYQGPGSGDGNTHFTIQGVAPGDYVVYIWPQDLQIEYANADYMRQFDSYGQRITVTPDGKASVTIDKALLSTMKN